MTELSSRFSLVRTWLGIERNTTTHGEKWISAVGALLGIALVYLTTHWTFPRGFDGNHPGAVLMLGSMGASAVLLFVVPHGALSQPWAVVGGHLISAFIGVSCQKLLPGHAWTGALAVGAAVCVMYYLRCIHPPGGATSLAAVIGGPDVHALGYQYLLTPAALNVAVILLTAVAYNACFAWRRYPVHLHRRKIETGTVSPAQRRYDLTQEDFQAAIGELNSFVDINEEHLTELLELAKRHAERGSTHPPRIEAGHCYSNGRLGRLWSVRRVRALPAANSGSPPQVEYEVLTGSDTGQSGRCGLEEFRAWARFEVEARSAGRWARL